MIMEERKNTAVQALDKSELTELSTVRVRFLEKRKNILEGVCITGGEPTLQPDLEDLKRQTKNLYRYRVGNVVVEFDYLHNGRTVNDLFALMVQAGM